MKSATWARLMIAVLSSTSVIAPARAERKASVDVAVSAGLASNPYLVNNGSSGVRPSATIEIAPHLRSGDDITTVRLDGSASWVEYFGRYRTNKNLGINGGIDHRVSPQVSVRADAGFDTSIVGLNQALFGVVDPSNPEVTYPVVSDDVSLTGGGDRRYSYTAGVGGSYRMSEQSSMTVDGRAVLARFNGGSTLNEYNNYSASVGYSRRVSPVMSLGARMGYSRANYLRTALGDANIWSPAATVNYQISPTVTFQGNAGVSFVRINDLAGRTNHTSFSGDASLCSAGLNVRYCLIGARATVPSGRDGLRTQTSVSASMSRQLSRLGSATATVGYSWASEPLSNVVATSPGKVRYVSASAAYNHQVGERTSAFVAAGYSDSFESGINRRANIQVSAGIRIRLGDIR
jgi:hypothetical protein